MLASAGQDTDFLGKQEFVWAAVRCYLRDFFGALEASSLLS